MNKGAISKKLLATADKCIKDHACAKQGPEVCCKVVDSILSEMIFVNGGGNCVCPYRYYYADRHFCICPVRKAIWVEKGE